MRATTDFRASAFGLDVRSTTPLSLLRGSLAAPTGRELRVSVETRSAEPEWLEAADLVCDQRQPDGTVLFQIRAHPSEGFFISGPEHGAYLLSADGRQLACAPRGRREEVWQRLLIAQVLPFAALLRGLEVLHASAVVHEQRTTALLGPSRAGKTSLALELCARGATFLADDVVAVECAGGDLLAHAGSPIAGLDHAEAERLERTGELSQREIVAGNSREQLLRMPGAPGAAPLRALFLLERRADGPAEPRFEPAPEPHLLLSATFNAVLTAPPRLRTLLDVCCLAARQRVERVFAGPGVDASRLADAIERRLVTPL